MRDYTDEQFDRMLEERAAAGKRESRAFARWLSTRNIHPMVLIDVLTAELGNAVTAAYVHCSDDPLLDGARVKDNVVWALAKAAERAEVADA